MNYNYDDVDLWIERMQIDAIIEAEYSKWLEGIHQGPIENDDGFEEYVLENI